MTQAIINNLNNVQIGGCVNEMESSINDAFIDSEMLYDKDMPSSFNDIMNQISSKQECILGSANREVSNGDMLEEFSKLVQVLTNETREANMENSLDLTLAKDISEIIAQLKSACVSVEEYKDDESFKNDDLQKHSDQENIDTEEQDSSIAIVFDQVLQLLNPKDKVLNNSENLIIKNSTIENSTVEPKNSGLQDNKMTLPNGILKDAEKVEIKDALKEIEINQEIFDELQIETIESTTDNSSENAFTNKQSPEEFSIKVMLNNTDKTSLDFETYVHTSSSKAQTVNADKVLEQITKQMNSMNNSSKVNIVLNPETLGKLNIQIINTKDGLTAQFTVTTNEAREILMKGLDGLKENLITHGIGVDNISVKISEPEESSYNPDWTEQENSEHNQKEQQKQKHGEKEKNSFEKAIAENLSKKNGNV